MCAESDSEAGSKAASFRGEGFEASSRDPFDVQGGRRAIDFADAEAFLSRGSADDGEDAWSSNAFGQKRDTQIAALSQWADAAQWWLSAKQLSGRVRGRMEHDILRVGEPISRVFKITKGPKFGFYPDADPRMVSGMVSDWFGLVPATPLQYLRRMALTHELFPALDHRLEGFAMLEKQFRIVISQRFVEPRSASQKEIAEFFTTAGFERFLPEAWYRATDNVAIFDAGTTNIIEFSDRLFPIDILPVRPGGILLKRILEALKMPPSSR